MRADLEGFDAEKEIRELYAAAGGTNALDRMLRADVEARLPDHPLMVLDRMSMAHGLEARSPLVDHELVEFMARLRPNLKIRRWKTRYLQRRIAEKYLPAQLLRRPKQGFHSALPYMLRDDLRKLFAMFLSGSRLAEHGYLEQTFVDALVQQQISTRRDHMSKLWLLLHAELWYRMHINGESREKLRGQIAMATSCS
jgi:asparagine synthase (glutamine-hydrolysing)